MGWFGSSGGNTDSTPAAAARDFTSSDEAGFTSGSAEPMNMSSLASSSGVGGSTAAELQAFSMQLQEQLLVQQAISKMTQMGFEKCLEGKPGEQLSGREVSCIHATVGKWLDSNEFLMTRLAKKQQSGAGAAQF